jgi:hypothetical protein
MWAYYLWDEDPLSMYLIFKRLICFANCPSKCAIFSHRQLLVGRDIWAPFISVYWWTKGMHRWNSCCQCKVMSRHCPIEDGSCSFFSRVWLGYVKSSLQLFLLPPITILTSCFGMPTFTTFNPSHMAISRIRMPSFTLVLTSGWHSLHGYPTAIKFDPCASYTKLPVVIDHLLVTNLLSLCGNHDANLYVL